MFCLSRGKEVAARHPALARVKWAWEFGGFAASAASPLAASPHARRSREISAAGGGSPKPAGGLPSSRVAAPPGAPFAGDHATGPPLTQARRIAADSCPLAAAIPSPVDSVHSSRPGVPCLFCCAHRNILIIMSVLFMETRLGQAAPCFVAAEAIPAAYLPCRRYESGC